MNLEPLRGLTFGANVSGLTMHEINAGDWSRIEVGLADFGLLRLRGQQFDARSVAAFARRFGELEGDIGEARGISNKGEDAAPLDMGDPAWLTRAYPTRYWHADGTFNRVAPRVCVLAGAAIPAAGACTEFADMCAAWDMLDHAQQRELEPLTCFHSNLVGSTRVLPAAHALVLESQLHPAPVDGSYGLGYRTEVPLRSLVRRHPGNGRKVLAIGRHAFGVVGLDPEASDQLLRGLEARACQPPRVFRQEWWVGDVVVFDNRRVLHRAEACAETGDERLLLNCRVKGDPVHDAGLDTPEAQASAACQHAELQRLRRAKRLGQAKGLGRAGDAAV